MKIENQQIESARFHNVSFQEATFEDVNLASATFHDINLSNVTLTNVNLSDVRISDANIDGLTIDGIDIQPLLAAEQKRRSMELGIGHEAAVSMAASPQERGGSMRDLTLQLLDEQGAFGVIEFLAAQPDPLISTRTFSEVVGHLYWKQKDLHRTVVMAQAGIQFGLTVAIAANGSDPDRAKEIRGVAKGLAYDLASFTWPGWAEPGIEIGGAYLPFGQEAARLNLRLAHDLNKGDLPVSRAFWLVGAHCLAACQHQEAADYFTTAETYAQTAGASGEVLLAQGYRCLATALLTPEEAGNDGPLVRILAQLAETQEGADLAAQLQTAWTVFARSCPDG